MRQIRVPLAAIALVGAMILPAASAGATSDYQRVLQTYQRKGVIPPCQFTTSALESASRGVNSYGAQYFADFTQAIQVALSTRAAGGCSGAAASIVAAAAPELPPGPVGGSGPGVGIPAHLGSVTAPTNAGVPAPLALLGVLALVGALAVGVTLVLRARS